MNEKQVTPALLKRYVDGSCDASECQVVEEWLQNGAPDAEHSEAFYAVDQEALRDRLWDAIAPVEKVERRPRIWWWAAAAIMVSAFSIWFLTPDANSVHEMKHSMQTFEAKPGQRLTATLPDGSTVRLNAGTRIWYNLPFDERTLVIEGEGLFDIVHDPAHPFTVKTSKGKVRVLGTSFAVKSYRESEATEISVLRGLVACSTKKADFSVRLQKGESVRFNSKAMDNKSTIADEDIAPWTKDILAFKGQTFSEVIGELERWFGVRVHLDSPTENLGGAFRAKFINPTLKDVMQSLCFSLDLKYKITKNDIYIYN
ncbi:FecR family protein [Sphingobacterium pedocola]|uniref:Iron dicitrate transport regulator FecR n=1 Tax=Sphingobacterium pedocola TaxID=2082722 RepID=A0ABR9TBD6_9SPHI|nr:FecR family protein [Sphingobacterium pedocola]MBE8722670.1 hypothetical protein [Sphingobacterium pedocola]